MNADFGTFDTVLKLCQDQHRRIVLAVLAEKQRSVPLKDLTHTILKYDPQTPITKPSEDVGAEIRSSLHHVHLPKLASEGLITYDSERQFVEPTEQFDQVQPMLTTILDADPALEVPLELPCFATD